jgi:hypothetical protein
VIKTKLSAFDVGHPLLLVGTMAEYRKKTGINERKREREKERERERERNRETERA